MSATSLFRLVLVAGLVFSIIGAVSGISLTDTLPQSLQDYLTEVDGESISGGELMFYILAMLSVLLLLLISTIGLWNFRSWARALYVVILVASIPFFPITGPVVMNGWEAMFNEIALILDGVLLAMMFTGEVNQKFKSIEPQVKTANS